MAVRRAAKLSATRPSGTVARARVGRTGIMAPMTDEETAKGTGSANDFLPPDPTLERMQLAVQECRGCGLYARATQAVFGKGIRTAEIMLVGEQPGDKEDLAGEPFVGPSGEAARHGPRRNRHRAALGLRHERGQALQVEERSERQAAPPRQAERLRDLCLPTVAGPRGRAE